MSESRVLAEIEAAASHYRICVLPRNPAKLAFPVWNLADPSHHVGILWRQNVGGFKKGKSFIRLGLPGLPDFIGFRFQTGQFWAIEAKTMSGKLSPDQAACAYLCASGGALTGVCRSYDEACALLECWGLKRTL